ncbi:hypothetical protein [Streptomyces sp. NPDC021096]|uniref:hypothetical protein n=1 Tax=Streptomyces sp. NPDC021096 TaxID=3154792 RepID=UPI0033DC330C
MAITHSHSFPQTPERRRPDDPGRIGHRWVGRVVHDSETDRIGRVMGKVESRYQLRRLDGGHEWEADGDSLEVVTPLRCEYIARLKVERRKAVEAGRANAAHLLTLAMCRHLRVMHP